MILYRMTLDLLHRLCLNPCCILGLACLFLKNHIRFMEFTAFRRFQSKLICHKPK